MDTKKLNHQNAGAAAIGAQVSNKQTVDNDKKMKAAAAATAGLAAGAGVAFGGYEAYQHFAGGDTAVEAEPISDDAALDAVAGLTADNVAAPVVEPQPVDAQPAEAATVEPAQPTTTTTTSATTTTTPAEHTSPAVNPDEVSDEILAADIIDPTDAQAGDFPYEVGDVAQVYNVNGELETVASITDESGAEMMLVDVNGDQMFDVARDGYGNEVELGVVSSVDDMRLLYAQQHDDSNGYLAADDTTPTDDNSFEADIIDPNTLG